MRQKYRRSGAAQRHIRCVRAEHAYSGTSCGSLTLEVGKSPTEVTRGRHVPGSLPSAICEFDSSSSCSWSLNRAVLETDANMVSRTSAGSARSTRSWCLRYSPWPRRQYVDGRAPQRATPWLSIDAAPRHCAPLPAALPEPQCSQISRHACAQPAAQSPGDARTCVSSLGSSWARS